MVRRIGLGSRQQLDRARLVVEEHAVLAEHLAVEHHVEGADGSAGPHCSQQRRVGAAARMAVQVQPGVAVELVEQVLVPHAAQQPDPVVGSSHRLDPGGVVVGVRRRADHHEGQHSIARVIGAHDQLDVVLGLEAGDDEVVLLALEAHLGEAVGSEVAQHLGAVGDLAGGDPELLFVVLGDAASIGDQRIGPAHRSCLGDAVVAPAEPTPLGPAPLEAVDVDGDRSAEPAHEGHEERVARVEHDGRIEPTPTDDAVQRRQQCVRQRLERLATQRWQVHELHPEVLGRTSLAGCGAAVDRHLVAPRGESTAHFLDRGLEAAIARRHTTSPDEGDPQGPMVRRAISRLRHVVRVGNVTFRRLLTVSRCALARQGLDTVRACPCTLSACRPVVQREP